MRVLMLGRGWFPSEVGGLDRYYRQLIEQLPEARGVVVGPARDASDAVTVVSEHSAPLRARLLTFTRAATREARDADVIDVHFALYALLPLLSRGLRRRPMIVHFQGPWAQENVVAGDASRWRRHARRGLERAVYSHAQVVVTLTGAFRRVLIEDYRVSPWRTIVLAPGVDLDRFSIGDRSAGRARFGLAPDAFVVCCVRRLEARMGLEILLESWSQDLSRDPRARLLIAGVGELRAALQEQIGAAGLGESVTLLGRICDRDLVSLYRAADVNVVPSVSLEGFGLITLEAAACGTPSIVTRAGGLPEAISGLGDDLIVAPSDAGALAQRLAGTRQGDMPSRAQTRTWAERHDWKHVADAHRRLFARVLDLSPDAPRKLRVVYVNHVALLSGGELALLRLLKALPHVDAHVILVEHGPLVDALIAAGVSVEVLPMRSGTRQLRKDSIRRGGPPLRAVFDTLTYSLRLAWRIRQIAPDVVHTNSLKAGVYGSIAARLARRPVVWHVRDRISTDYLPSRAVTLIRFATRHLPTVIVTNSESTKSTLGQGHRVPVMCCPDLVNRRPGGRPAAEAPHHPLVVGMISRLAPWKGQDVFLRAFALAFSDGDERAVIVGAPLFGPSEVEYGEQLRRLVNTLDIAGRVEFRGHRHDIAMELGTMDVLVHASTIAEPFGQVVIEGMSARLAVVASLGGGPEEIITDGVDGLFHPPGDVAALSRILVRLGAEPELRTRLGRAAGLRADDFSPEVTAQRMMHVYNRATSGR